jgi:hypothetical protein
MASIGKTKAFNSIDADREALRRLTTSIAIIAKDGKRED